MIEPNSKKEDYNIDSERIRELISKYEQIKNSGEIKKYNEESTKKDFILPLFKALGWNVDNRGKRNDTVSAEETISKKRVDYGFRINGIPKFFLEAKSLKEENIQTNPKYVTQAIDYAWMKSCSWAILTNFETIAVYNSDWKSGYFGGNLFFVLRPNDFLTDSRFINLSKGAFENNELDKTASKYGKKQVKNPINKQLLQDMIHFREVLSKYIVRNNQDKNLTQDDIDETVQRILDRLIFIRNAEDRGLEENQLQSNVRQWYAKGKGHLVKEISRIYKDYDDKYNSKLFAHHLCDDLYIENEALQEVIEGLNQSKDNSYRYDFSIIESDVLGNIYEQYLGNILKSTPKRAKLEESKTHRKEQGIYYTPSYIVDYIVKNTVGEFIKNHTPEEIRKVRIVDPACGSGSFLIRAYRELENYWKQNSDFAQLTLDSEEFYSKKVEILKNNIFGVDLDHKAVEIAQLNLLLQISEKKQRLPLLQNNIKVGNSLIDDPSISDRAFKWESEFPEIMKDGGFDIVIGNPPYGVTFSENEKDNIKRQYISASGNYDSYHYFIEQSVKLLKERGILSFITPDTWLTNVYTEKLRIFILDNCKILQIVRLPQNVFSDANVDTCIVLLQKTSKAEKNSDVTVLKLGKAVALPNLTTRNFDEKFTVRQEIWRKERRHLFNINISPRNQNIISKINEGCTRLGDITEMRRGVFCYRKSSLIEQHGVSKGNEILQKRLWHADRKLGDEYKKELLGSDVGRYRLEWKNKKWFRYGKFMASYVEPRFFDNGYIAVQRIRNPKLKDRLVATLIPKNQEYYASSGLTTIILSDKQFDERYVLGILNSKLMNWYYRHFYQDVNIKPEDMKELPIKIANKGQTKELVELVEKLLELNKQIVGFMAKETDQLRDLVKQAKNVDTKIDELIYTIYDLSISDIKLIEGEE